MAFLRSEARFNAFIGGIGSGKSYAGAWRRVVRAQPGRLYMIGAPTYPMLRDATLRTFLQVAGPLVRDFNRSEMIVTLHNGAQFLCRSTDDPERLRGPNLSGFWLDEGSLMDPAVWPIMLGRLREGGTAGEGDLTGTPKGFNWTYDTFGPDAPMIATGEARAFYTRTDDNPFVAPEFVASLRRAYTGAFARQELDGAFTALDGGLFKREWFTELDTRPGDVAQWVRFWDLAVSTKAGADYTVGALVGQRASGHLVIADIVRGRWEWPDARHVISSTAQTDPPGTRIGVEQVAFQLAAIQELAREPALLNRTITPVVPTRDKYSRAMPWASRAEQGLVQVVRGPWLPAFYAEIADFPHGKDDQVDGVSGGVDLLTVPPVGVRWLG